MTEKPITDLRRRMLQDMTNRNFSAKTQHDYIRHIETFAKFLDRAPDTATGDDIRRFQAEQMPSTVIDGHSWALLLIEEHCTENP